MKVTLEHGEAKVGIFKSAPVIKLTVEFSEVEREVINRTGLAEHSYYTAPIHKHFNERMQAPSLVKNLLSGKPNTFHFDDLVIARAQEPQIKEGLKNLKAAIEANTEPLKASDTFEL